MRRPTKERVNYRLDPDVLAALRVVARRERTTVTDVVDTALRLHLGLTTVALVRAQRKGARHAR